MYKDLAARIGKVLEVSSQATISGPRQDGRVEMEWETWSAGVSFTQLMEISNILGTMRFDVMYRKVDGCTSDAGTWWPGEEYIAIRFNSKDVQND